MYDLVDSIYRTFYIQKLVHFLAMQHMQQTTGSSLERSALIVATLTSFLGPFTISSVNVALPAIQSDLQMNAVQLSWIATAYLLAVAIGLVPAGKIADIHGRKKVFATGLAVYTAGSFMAVFTTSAPLFITLRIVQGLGAAMFVTTGMAILTSIFPANRRGRVIGIYVAAVYIGLSVGPLAGGFFTQHFGWRSIFVILLPLGILSLLLTLSKLRGEWRGEPGQHLDLVGCLLYASTILALVYGATLVPSPAGLSLSACGIVLLYIFVKHQLRVRFPVFDVKLFAQNKTFAFSSLAALLHYSATFAVTFLMSLYLQYIKEMSPQTAGSVLMAQPIMMAILSPLAGRIADRLEPRLLATAGMIVTVVSVAMFIGLSPATSLYAIIANLILLGTGFAFFSSPNMSAIMGAVEKRHYGLASGTVATMRLLGQMLSMAVATVVLAVLIGREAITPDNYNLFLQSVHTVFTISALFCLSGVYFSWFRGAVLHQPWENGDNGR
ncbi:MFS transporter [Desulforhopalus singaporensis]|uniref:Drug resistance transporter, EmrB/QacA subfamily n=1 Tax=Desulforhopalus singaporensis TaxID=91360 RepID=A0A1H0U3M0_9BACT|nr:MFS transporter [Desulforhopalus singaporensis]SDP60660.1 drug resistance transporter, EmrB/QacA subfamily [Desulforhopalus singaporensis]